MQKMFGLVITFYSFHFSLFPPAVGFSLRIMRDILQRNIVLITEWKSNTIRLYCNLWHQRVERDCQLQAVSSVFGFLRASSGNFSRAIFFKRTSLDDTITPTDAMNPPNYLELQNFSRFLCSLKFVSFTLFHPSYCYKIIMEGMEHFKTFSHSYL